MRRCLAGRERLTAFARPFLITAAAALLLLLPANAGARSSAAATTQTLTVVFAGTGSGQVGDVRLGGLLHCTATCSVEYPTGQTAWLLTGTPPGSVFTGWSGDCTGTGFCDLTMNEPHTVTATFETTAQQVTTKSLVQHSIAAAGSVDSYSITISNPNSSAVTLNSIYDTLPSGFAYVAGSTTGITSANPTVSSQTLTWSGPFTVPANGSVSLSFSVIVASAPGDYYNNAGGDAAGGYTVLASGPTAHVQVYVNAIGAPTLSHTIDGANATFVFSGQQGATFKCSLDGATLSTCTSPISLSGLPDGNHTFEVRQYVNGSESLAATFAWTVATAPQCPISVPPTPPNEANTCVVADVLSTITVTAPSLIAFPPLAVGETSAPADAPVNVKSNTGYQLSVTRTAFTNGDIPLSVQAAGAAPAGAAFDLSALAAIPVVSSIDIGHRLGSSTPDTGDTWPLSLVLGPVPAVAAGTHASIVTFTAVAF